MAPLLASEEDLTRLTFLAMVEPLLFSQWPQLAFQQEFEFQFFPHQVDPLRFSHAISDDLLIFKFNHLTWVDLIYKRLAPHRL